MRYITYAFWLLIILVAASFAIINSRTVELHYYLGSINIYFPLLLLIELAIGTLLGVLAMTPAYLRMKNANRKLRQQLKKAE